MSSGSDLKTLFERKKELIDEYLRETLSKKEIPDILAQSIAYSLLDGGKRVRPALCVITAESLGVEPSRVLPLAAAFEMVHTASLIHDDLPCMDNDDYRRGKLTNHKVYGEAMAVLAGDSLLAFAFEISLNELPKQGFSQSHILRALGILSNAIGPSGICGGQALDITQVYNEEFLWKMSELKTATLLRASLTAPAALVGVDEQTMSCLHSYGTHMGISFQIVDDILDVTGTITELGKTPGKDEASGKVTFVSFYGLQKAKELALNEAKKAVKAIAPLSEEFKVFTEIVEHFTRRSR